MRTSVLQQQRDRDEARRIQARLADLTDPTPEAYWSGNYLHCPKCHMRQQQAGSMKRGTLTVCPLCEGRYRIP